MIGISMSRIASFTDLGSHIAIDDLSFTMVANSPTHSGVNSSENPLHVAVKLGQPQVVTEILSKNAKLALELNREGFTALHLACWSGNLEVVKLLIQANTELCLVRDKFGRTTLHTAAMKGRVSILRELLGACPESVMELTAASETPLHVAVTHAQVEAVKVLADWLREESLYHDLINKKDCCGNTVLHLATSRKQLQTLKLLLADSPTYCAMVDVNAINDGGFTALDILDVLPQCGKIDMEIEKYLRRAGALRAKDLVQRELDYSNQELFIKFKNQPSHLQTTRPMKNRYRSPSDAYHVLLLTATLLAAITFYTALHTPGGRLELEESYKYKSTMKGVFQTEKQSQFLTRLFLLFNSIAFFTSVAIIIVLLHELPLKPWPLISVFSMLGAYICLIMLVSPPHEAMALLFLCSPVILLAAASKYLAFHTMVLEYLRCICIRIHQII